MLINLKLAFVVVNFFLTQVMYANKVATKEKIKITPDKKFTATYMSKLYSFRQKVLKLFPRKKFLFKILDFSLYHH